MIYLKLGVSVMIGWYMLIVYCVIVYGLCKVGDGVFVGFNSVLFNCMIDDGCVVCYNVVVDGCYLLLGFYVCLIECIGLEIDFVVLL